MFQIKVNNPLFNLTFNINVTTEAIVTLFFHSLQKTKENLETIYYFGKKKD